MSSCTSVCFCGPREETCELQQKHAWGKYPSNLSLPPSPYWLLADLQLCRGQCYNCIFLPSSSLGSALRPRLVRVCGETELGFIKTFHQQQQITTGSCQESAALGTHRRGRRSLNIALEHFLIVCMNRLVNVKKFKSSISRCFLTWRLHWRRLDCVVQFMWSSFEVCVRVWGNECRVPGKLHFLVLRLCLCFSPC